MDNVLKQFQENSYLYGGNADFIESLYELYLEDPEQISHKWREYFDQIQENNIQDTSHTDAFKTFAATPRIDFSKTPSPVESNNTQKQLAVVALIEAYRSRGHQQATLNPLEFHQRPPVAALDPEFHGLSSSDMSQSFNTSFPTGPLQLSLSEILLHLKQAYCGNFSVEYIHIASTLQKRWIQERFETFPTRPEFMPEKKRQILKRVIAAEGIEKYLHTKYVGQKRFSLEGGESLIIILDELLQDAANMKVEETVIGMAHRGRLNVLVNILGKSPRELYQEFEGSKQEPPDARPGDVKYHQGFSSNIETADGSMHLALAFNPSHLEIIDPVVIGSVRARQRRRSDHNGHQVLPILIHGDSAFAAQGVVMETLNMSQAQGYTVGGTVHIIVNNQIGFTTSNPLDMRSTVYCSDVAKMVQAPIFHVNGDDPEAVVFITQMALEFRMKFHRDVVIDMICYRRHGHNEADEPAATQPMMYQKIKAHPTTAALYAEQLIRENILSQNDVEQMSVQYRNALDQGDVVARNILPHPDNKMVNWEPYKQVEWDHKTDTTLSLEKIKQLASSLNKTPDGFELHPRVEKVLINRNKMAVGAQLIDWGFAETIAYASLLTEGYPIRLSGQDSGRGTFFHRHAVLHNQKDGESYTPLQHLSENQAQFIVIDSLLSEEAVLGFEYGYSTTDPNSLTIWEAQFGDFANGAQVVIDQFITSGEAKWRRLCGLVLFLPHGYEGQGPEHSSARIERYLQLCADHNIQLCNPTTPAQMFHMLRRQMIRPYRKPLIVFTPKSLLRHKLATSTLDDLSQGAFKTIIAEQEDQTKKQVKRLVFCSGKIYYDLLDARKTREIDNIALIRIEQLYPFPHDELTKLIKQYPNAKEIVWCQEEPKNQGAWYQTQHNIQEFMRDDQTLFYAGPAASASPAAGRFKLHLQIQKQLIDDALRVTNNEN